MNYVQLYQAIQDYSENTESLFVSNISTFVKEAEDRIYNSVQIPSLRKNVTGTLTASNKYLSCPNDFLSTYSIAVIDGDGNYSYLLNKDVNFIREAYPNGTSVGLGALPKYYALFGSQYSNPNELSFILGPTPGGNYSIELHYFYYPVSIVQGAISSYNTPTGGSSYTNGVYPNVPLTGGQGSGATATVTVSGNTVTTVTINNGGQFYAVNDSLTAASSYIGGTGSGFSVTVRLVSNADGTSWLGDNYDPVLFYGAMREAMLFMKGEQDLVKYYEEKYAEALSQLNRLGSGLERGDAYREGQSRIGQVKP
jgi:hypothetical protein